MPGPQPITRPSVPPCPAACLHALRSQQPHHHNGGRHPAADVRLVQIMARLHLAPLLGLERLLQPGGGQPLLQPQAALSQSQTLSEEGGGMRQGEGRQVTADFRRQGEESPPNIYGVVGG